MIRIRQTFLGILMVLVALPAAAQQPAGESLVDRVVAVVGDSVVLASELEEQLLRLAASGRPLPQDPRELDRLRRQLLDPLVNQLLLVQAAARDSIVVDLSDVEAQVDAEIQQRRRAMGGAAAFQQALQQAGLTEARFRRNLEEELRQTMMIQQYLAKVRQERRAPPVTIQEMRQFFEAQRGDMGTRPATITFRQVVVSPEPPDSAKAAARAEAQTILEQLQEGADFEALARRHSDDPGSAQRGGELGWFRPGQMVPEFEAVAFALRPGQTSGIVETDFGYHIIRVEKVKGPERQARHILIAPEMPEGAADSARALARDVALLARDGVPMDSLRAVYGDETEEFRVGPALRASLPEPYAAELAEAREGQVIGPLQITSRGQPRWAVVKVTEVRESGEYTFDDEQVRSQIREQLEQEKLLDEIVEELRARTYIDIRL